MRAILLFAILTSATFGQIQSGDVYRSLEGEPVVVTVHTAPGELLDGMPAAFFRLETANGGTSNALCYETAWISGGVQSSECVFDDDAGGYVREFYVHSSLLYQLDRLGAPKLLYPYQTINEGAISSPPTMLFDMGDGDTIDGGAFSPPTIEDPETDAPGVPAHMPGWHPPKPPEDHDDDWTTMTREEWNWNFPGEELPPRRSEERTDEGAPRGGGGCGDCGAPPPGTLGVGDNLDGEGDGFDVVLGW